MIKILIPEETPSRNKGEAAILIGMLETFKILGEKTHVSMFSLDPDTDSARYEDIVEIIDARGVMPGSIMDKSKGRFQKSFEYLLFLIQHSCFLLLRFMLRDKVTLFMRRPVWSHYCQADIIVMAHDSAFAPLYHSALTLFFKWQKKLVVIYGGTISPGQKSSDIKKKFYNFLVGSILSKADIIMLREKKSYLYVKKMAGEKTSVHLTADLAFISPPAQNQRVNEIMQTESLNFDGPLIGVTLSRNKVPFAFSNIQDLTQKETSFIGTMASVIDYMIKNFNATIVFVPHCIIEDSHRDDRLLARKVLENVVNKEKVKLINNEYSAEEVKGLAGKCEFCFGTRLHFIVDASSMGVPFIILTNRTDYRVHGIVGEMLGQKEWIHDIEDLTEENFIERINQAWKLKEITRKKLEEKTNEINKKVLLNGELLKDLYEKAK